MSGAVIARRCTGLPRSGTARSASGSTPSAASWRTGWALQAAALTYYTVFAMVPMLVVALWILKAFDWLPAVSPTLPANVVVPSGNQMLQAMLGMILETVDRTTELVSGIVGLAALLFAVSKMFGYTERALHIIAASGQRTPKFSRVLAYVALLLIPPVALAISGLSLFLIRGSPNNPLSRLLAAIPGVEIALGFLLAFAALWLAVTLLYTAAVRARIPFRSAAVGGAVAALALVVISWAFGNFQIGVSHTQHRELGVPGVSSLPAVGDVVLVRRAGRRRDRGQPSRRQRAGARGGHVSPGQRGRAPRGHRDHVAPDARGDRRHRAYR